MSTSLDKSIEEFHWLLEKFSEDTAGVNEALAVSSDGILLASSEGLDRKNVEQFAAVVAGLTSITMGAADMFDYDGVKQVIVEMGKGYLFVVSMSGTATLAALTDDRADLALVGYETMMLVQRAAKLLSPEVISELKNSLAV